MTDHLALIKSVNCDFANILRNSTFKWPEFENWMAFEKAIKETQSPAIVVPTHKGYLSSFYSKAITVAEEITSFWKNKTEQYSKALQSLPGSKIRVERHEDALICGMYFDTVILPLQLISSIEGGSYTYVPDLIAVELFRINQLITLLEADEDIPIIAFSFASARIQTIDLQNSLQPKNYIVDTAIIDNKPNSLSWHDTKFILRSEFNIDLPDKIKQKDVVTLANQLCNAKDSSKNSFLEYFLSINLADEGFAESDLLAHLRGKKQAISPHEIFGLITRLNGIFYDIALAEEDCLECGADPLIMNSKAYETHLSLASAHAINSLKLFSEQAIAHTLYAPQLAWLSGLTPSDLIQFREKEGLNYFRNIFRKHISELKKASNNDFEKIAHKVNNRLREEIIEHEQYILKSKNNSAKEKYKIALSTGFTISLALTSVVTPPLVAIPATIISAVAGGNTVHEAWKRYNSEKKRTITAKERPIGIIAKLSK